MEGGGSKILKFLKMTTMFLMGWWNIKLTKATQMLTQELSGEQFRGNLGFTWVEEGGGGGVKYSSS